MAATLDVSEPAKIHPADKQTVAARLALAARHGVRGRYSIQFPLFRQVTTDADGMRVWFDHAEGLTTRGKPVEGFEVAGDDHKFVPAEAEIDGQTVLVKHGAVGHPVFVRYAWGGIAPSALCNSAGLPAATFSSETTPSY